MAENNSSAPLKTAPVSLAEHRANHIYIAGPMTGLPDLNFPAFNAAANELRVEGWHVENPAEHGIVDGAQWSDYMHTDLQQLSTCCAIYLLPGWSKSRGATLEAHVAKALGMAVYYAPNAETQAVAAQAAPAAVAVPEITDAMVDAYLAEQRRTVEEADRFGRSNIGGLHTNTVRDACRNGLRAALAATPALPATEDSSAGDLAEGHPWKDHMTAQLVNQLVSVAKQFHGAQQLRERIAGLIRPLADRVKAEVQAEPVAAGEYLPLPMQYACAGPFPVYSAYQMRAYADAHRSTAPQSQPADAAIAEKAAKYDRLVPYLCKTCSGFGIVGGHCQDGSFDSQPCPDCNQPTHTLTQAVLDVLAERARQIEDKGYEPEADDVYEDAQLAAAAATYALLATGADGWRVDDHWPWSAELSLKKGEPRRMLEKAGALILAEMERLDRAAAAQEGGTTADQGLPLLQDGQENGYGTCTIDATMPPAQEGGKA